MYEGCCWGWVGVWGMGLTFFFGKVKMVSRGECVYWLKLKGCCACKLKVKPVSFVGTAWHSFIYFQFLTKMNSLQEKVEERGVVCGCCVLYGMVRVSVRARSRSLEGVGSSSMGKPYWSVNWWSTRIKNVVRGMPVYWLELTRRWTSRLEFFFVYWRRSLNFFGSMALVKRETQRQQRVIKEKGNELLEAAERILKENTQRVWRQRSSNLCENAKE